MNRKLVACVLTIALLGLAGCGSAPNPPSSQRPRAVSSSAPFGPVYSTRSGAAIADPLVAGTVERDAANPSDVAKPSDVSTSPAVSAEIRGYLVYWDSKKSAMRLVVMKDGAVFRFGQVGGVWTMPQPRLRPEPAVEAQARKAAVASAQRNVVAKKYPQYANSTPDIGEYLVRITRADGAVTDVWVWPDLSSFDYGVRLDPVSK